MLNILIIDNHDSFTYNLVETLRQTDLCRVTVINVNEVIMPEIIQNADGVILSPGPGLPHEKKGLFEIINAWVGKKPMLGVCLGHQALVQYFGGQLYQLKNIMHGEQSEILVKQNSKLFLDIEKPIVVGRYHSWAVTYKNFPQQLAITAVTKNKIIMAFEHRTQNVLGMQFHPESILTPSGKKMLKNWIQYFLNTESSFTTA